MDFNVDMPNAEITPSVFTFFFDGEPQYDTSLLVTRPIGLLNRMIRSRHRVMMEFNSLESLGVFILGCSGELGAKAVEADILECLEHNLDLQFSVEEDDGQTPDVREMYFVEPEFSSFAVRTADKAILESLSLCSAHPKIPVWSPPADFWPRYGAWLLPQNHNGTQ